MTWAYFKKILNRFITFSWDKWNGDMSQEEAHNNFSDEFTSEVSIHLLLVFQFWQSTWQFFYGRQLFWVTAKVSTYLGIW